MTESSTPKDLEQTNENDYISRNKDNKKPTQDIIVQPYKMRLKR